MPCLRRLSNPKPPVAPPSGDGGGPGVDRKLMEMPAIAERRHNWDESSGWFPSRSSDFACGFVYEVIYWIALSNCVHFAFKKVVKLVADGIGDTERGKVVPLRLGLILIKNVSIQVLLLYTNVVNNGYYLERVDIQVVYRPRVQVDKLSLNNCTLEYKEGLGRMLFDCSLIAYVTFEAFDCSLIAYVTFEA
ncbi:hypothetical protein DKX38_013447 [Salix brachista]|uniref:Uncharacterized protein n=1 Tax=Salix brachista TaxID=2182728 RepID=A0A5N5LR86_9ROSI|nr:hypothetical protein DKX38_013447 [Salix brachista]